MLRSIVNHVFLPPKLPSGEDDGIWVPDVIDLILSSLSTFRDHQTGADADSVTVAIGSIRNFRETRTASGDISEPGLERMLGAEVLKGMGDIVTRK